MITNSLRTKLTKIKPCQYHGYTQIGNDWYALLCFDYGEHVFMYNLNLNLLRDTPELRFKLVMNLKAQNLPNILCKMICDSINYFTVFCLGK